MEKYRLGEEVMLDKRKALITSISLKPYDSKKVEYIIYVERKFLQVDEEDIKPIERKK